MASIGSDIFCAKEILENGDVVAIPTETVYGLAANALNAEAVLKIFTVKNRPSFDPLIVHVSNFENAFKYVEEFPDKAQHLAKKFWPGPLTLLLKKKDIIPDLVTSGLDTVGIRCPNHPLTSKLLDILSFPLAAPSANPFGYISPTRASHVNDQLGNQIQYILDGGECKVGIESTIVGFEGEQAIIYRLGGLSIDEIENEIGKVNIQLNVSSNPLAPGQLKIHYAPRKKLVLGNLDKLIKEYSQLKKGILSFSKKEEVSDGNQYISLSSSQNLNEAAKNLFDSLRLLDNMDIDIILTEEVPNIGIGRAINDRLKRAAAI